MKLKDIKASARESLAGHWGVAILASIIASAFGATGASVTFSDTEDVDFSALSQLSQNEIIVTLAVFGGIILFGLVASIVISSLVSVGYAQFNLDLIDGADPKIATLFSKGKQILTTIVASILVFIRVFFGLVLFVIPGIIAIYKYAMVNYIIAENPDISARDALKESKECMRGNKFRFFLFGLSFFGWSLLVILTLGIASIWVLPYMQASFAAFYREVA